MRFDDVALSTARIDPAADVDLDLTLEAIFGGLTLVGDIRGPWVGECRRCLQPANGRFEARIEVLPGSDHFFYLRESLVGALVADHLSES